jgi:hypothetical protein
MLKWTPNSDNTKFHCELNEGNDNLYATLSGGIWRVEVWMNDHTKVQAWAGKVSMGDAQALAEALHETYRGWM